MPCHIMCPKPKKASQSKRTNNDTTRSPTSFLIDHILQSTSLAREDALVQTDTDRVLGVDLGVEGSLEITVRTEGFLDITAAAASGPELEGLEPLDVLGVEEHVTDGDDALVDLVWVTGEDGALGNDAGLVGGHDGAVSDEFEVVEVVEGVVLGGVHNLGVLVGLVLEDEDRHGAPGQRTNPGGDGAAAWVEEAVELVHVVGGVVAGGEDGVDDQTARTALDDELLLRLQGLLDAGVQVHVDVDNGVLVLMTE